MLNWEHSHFETCHIGTSTIRDCTTALFQVTMYRQFARKVGPGANSALSRFSSLRLWLSRTTRDREWTNQLVRYKIIFGFFQFVLDYSSIFQFLPEEKYFVLFLPDIPEEMCFPEKTQITTRMNMNIHNRQMYKQKSNSSKLALDKYWNKILEKWNLSRQRKGQHTYSVIVFGWSIPWTLSLISTALCWKTNACRQTVQNQPLTHLPHLIYKQRNSSF